MKKEACQSCRVVGLVLCPAGSCAQCHGRFALDFAACVARHADLRAALDGDGSATAVTVALDAIFGGSVAPRAAR